MFKKLLSNLPFNPSLIGQVSFYAKRMHSESAIRRIGMMLITLAFVLQLFAFIKPAEASVQTSGNDIIPGGFTTQARALDWCVNDRGIRTIYATMGITCDAIKNAVVKTQNTRDYNSQLFSLGRYPYGKAGESAINIEGSNFYQRYLWSWGTYNFQALVGSRTDGTLFMIMFDCGNPVSIGPYTPPAPTPPTPTPTPTPAPAPVPVPKPKCPLDNSLDASDARCKVCPYNSNILISNSACQPPKCPLDNSIKLDDARCKSCPYNSQILRDNPKCQQCPYPGLTTLGKDNPYCKEPCPFNSSIAKDSPACKPCEKSTTDSDTTSCLILTKSAVNTTHGGSNADGTTASGGDVIDYTLETKNTGKIAVKNFVVQEDIGDLSEYADVLDLHGGKLDNQTKIVSWSAATIAAGATLKQHITVKIKNPVPQTPISKSNPGTGDLVMTNVYGNPINIKLPPSVVKTTEQITTTTLPNTGPGESLAVSFTITVIIAYFFARSRLLAKELDIVRVDYASTGGI